MEDKIDNLINDIMLEDNNIQYEYLTLLNKKVTSMLNIVCRKNDENMFNDTLSDFIKTLSDEEYNDIEPIDKNILCRQYQV